MSQKLQILIHVPKKNSPIIAPIPLIFSTFIHSRSNMNKRSLIHFSLEQNYISLEALVRVLANCCSSTFILRKNLRLHIIVIIIKCRSINDLTRLSNYVYISDKFIYNVDVYISIWHSQKLKKKIVRNTITGLDQ